MPQLRPTSWNQSRICSKKSISGWKMFAIT
jgi:hypothetical protein